MRISTVPGVILALVVTVAAAGCGVASSMFAPPGGLADGPLDPNAIPPIIKVAEGVGPTGPYRAWVYRTKDSSWCMDVVLSDMGSGSCGPDASVLTSPGSAGDPSVGIVMTGGTRVPGAVSARVTLGSGDTQAVALARPGGFVPGDVAVYVIPLPKGATAASIDILDGTGTVLESIAVR